MEANKVIKIIEEHDIVDALRILIDMFESKSSVIYNLLLVERNILNRTYANYDLGIINQDEKLDSSKQIKKRLTQEIVKEIEEISINKTISKGITFKTKDLPNIFISYSWKNVQIANKIDNKLLEKGITLIRDIRDVKYTQSLKDFMKQVRNQDYVLMLISNDYLSSVNCMFEVLEIMKEKRFVSKILPVLLETNILSIEYRASIIDYWARSCNDIKKKISSLEPENAIGLYQELRKSKEIYSQVDFFLSTIKDMLCVSFSNLEKNHYKYLFEKIGLSQGPLSEHEQRIKNSRIYYKRANSIEKNESKVIKLTKAIVEDPGFLEAILKRAEIFYELRMYDEAIKDYNAAIEIDKDNAILYSERGINKRMAGLYNESILDFDTAIQLYPEFEEAYSNRGLAYDNIREYSKALKDFEKAIALNREFKQPYNNMAFTLRKIGEYDRAIKYIEAVLEIDSGYGYAYASLAEIYAIKKERGLFIDNIKKALENGCPVADYIDDPVYLDYIKDREFIELLRKYDYKYKKMTKS